MAREGVGALNDLGKRSHRVHIAAALNQLTYLFDWAGRDAEMWRAHDWLGHHRARRWQARADVPCIRLSGRAAQSDDCYGRPQRDAVPTHSPLPRFRARLLSSVSVANAPRKAELRACAVLWQCVGKQRDRRCSEARAAALRHVPNAKWPNGVP